MKILFAWFLQGVYFNYNGKSKRRNYEDFNC